MRTLLVLCGLLYALEGALYSALPPLLPVYAERFQLGDLAGGVLVGLYTAAVVPGTWLGSRLATRRDARHAVLVGLVGAASATLVLGLAADPTAVFGARLLQGLAAGVMWGGGLRWLLDVASPGRHGTVIGLALGATGVGTLAGPIVGAVTILWPPALAFTSLVPLALVAAFWTQPRPESRPTEGGPRGVYRHQLVYRVAWLVAVPSLGLGVVLALMPTHLAEVGGGPNGPALVFVFAGVVGGLTHVWAGRYADRRDPRFLIAGGLLLTAVAALTVGYADAWAVSAIATGVMVGPLYALTVTPAASVLAKSLLGKAGPGVVPIVTMTAVAGSEAVGSLLGGALAEVAHALPLLVVAVIGGMTALLLVRRSRPETARVRPPVGPSE